MEHISEYPHLTEILEQKSLRQILNSKELAQLGDFLVNFIYSTVKIAVKGGSGSIHVWDSSLKQAMEDANLRQFLGKRTKPGKVADAAEAFIAFCYFHKLMSLDDMIEYLSRRLIQEDFEVRTIEKTACGTAFGELLEKLALEAKKQHLIDPTLDL